MANIELTAVDRSADPQATDDQGEASSRPSGPVEPSHRNQTPPNNGWPDYLQENPDLHRLDPWQPIVLSLDGGGIRGLSSLYILQRLMQKIKSFEREEAEKAVNNNIKRSSIILEPTESSAVQQSGFAADPSAGNGVEDLRPCHYFDFMIGTSTGGLIAVLLGRLRLDVDTCIRIYEQLGTYVFGQGRWGRLTKYDHIKLKKAVKVVLKKYCVEHYNDGDCKGEDLLRQYDFSHLPCRFENHSCKVALMAWQEGDRKRGKQGDKPYLFRSYDHVEAAPENYNLSDPKELNPGRIQSNPTTIWEACRAASAAPLYFNKMTVRGVRYMDGGVGANNPVGYALNEAKQMALRSLRHEKTPTALISIGTGHKEPQSRFRNILHLLRWARKSITDTEEDHQNAQVTCRESNIPYFRFDVKEGLSKMKLDECRKRRTRKKKNDRKGKTRASNGAIGHANGPGNAGKHQTENVPDTLLFDTWRPARYDYVTYERIKESTIKYCEDRGGGHDRPVDVDAELTKAAQLLVYYRRRREESSRDGWDRFSNHPYYTVA